MTLAPVLQWRIDAATKRGLHNADVAALACRAAGLKYAVACALIEQESNGANVYGGHDGADAMLSGYPEPVGRGNFEAFLYEVKRGRVSNGVGPCQITYAGKLENGRRDGGYFTQMLDRGLRPWVPLDNMRFGFEIFAGNLRKTKSLRTAAGLYNGGSKWESSKYAQWYADELVARATAYQRLFQA